MRSVFRAPATLVLLLAALSLNGCTCGKKPAETVESPPAEKKNPALTPLPEAPQIQVQRENLPGADGSLAVVVGRPTGAASPSDFPPTITFNKPVMALETVETEKKEKPVASIEPAIPGEWRWLGSSTVEFVPKGLVPYATEFKVTVPAGLTALDGSVMSAPYSFEFSTPGPQLQVTDPADGFQWIPANQTFTLTFNQPVADLLQHVKVTAGGHDVAMTLVKEIDVAEELRASEKNRNYARESFEEKGFKNRQTRYQLAPAAPLPLDSEVVLSIDTKLRAKEGTLAMGVPRALHYRTYGPLNVLASYACMSGATPPSKDEYRPKCSWGPVVLAFTNPIKVDELEKHLTITPKVEIAWDEVESTLPSSWSGIHTPWVALRGKFHPGTTYTVKLAPGVQDTFGQTTTTSFVGTVKLDDLDPDFELGPELALIEAKGRSTLPVGSTNVSRAEVDVWTLSPEEFAQRTGPDGYELRKRPPARPATHLSLDLKAKPNEQKVTELDLRQALEGGKTSGLFLVQGSAPELPGGPQQVIAQITDLAVHSRLAPRSSAAWVTSLSTGKPVPQAIVRVYDVMGAKLFEGTADADGLVKLPGVAELLPNANVSDWETPFLLVTGTAGDDTGVTVSQWSSGVEPSSFELPTDWDGKRARSLGMMFTERGIYRPGDEVSFKGLVRFRRLGDIAKPPAGTAVKVVVNSSRGDKVFEKVLDLTDFGTFAGSFTVPKDAPLGGYDISATTHIDKEELSYSESFRVEEYRAPQFQVDVSVPSKNLVAGEPFAANVMARYLYGGAMTGAKVHWSLSRSTSSFAPPDNQGFAFGQDTWFWDDASPERSTDVVAGSDAESDAQGAVSVNLDKTDAPQSKPWDYTLEAEVTDVNRLRVANRASFTVHPASAYAGIKLGQGFAQTNQPLKMEIVAAAPDGKHVAGAKIAAVVKRREWKSIRKKGVGGHWSYESELVETPAGNCDVTSTDAATPCEVTPKEPGLYVVEATLTDDKGRKQVTRTSVYVVGPGWVSWQRNDTDRIELVPDKHLYDVGETAKILIKSPYPEAEAAITVEREGVSSIKHVTLKGAATTVDIPLDEAMLPNVFVGVVLVRGRVEKDKGIESGVDPGRPAVRVGLTELKIEKKRKRLTVAVKPDAVQKRPGDKVKVDVDVTDYTGAGHKAEVTAWAVDEAVLRLTNYELPDGVEAIHPRRGDSVRPGEPLMHLVLEAQKAAAEKGEESGGSGGGESTGGGFRSKFKTTVLFAPTLVTDDKGHATVEFQLPDNLTTFRIMAVALSAEDHFGGAQSKVEVSKPLLALPALPRIARVGDRFEAGIVVHPHGVQAADVKVTASAEGVGLAGEKEKTVSIADGRPHEVRFTFVPDGAGVATLRFKVEGGGESDGLEQKLPILLPVTTEAVATYGDTTDKRTEAIVPPGGVRPNVGGLEMTLSSTVLGNFDEGMRQLVDYPYGCLEQMSSRLVPFIALRELGGKFGLSAPTSNDDEQRKARDAFFTAWIGEPALHFEGATSPDEIVTKTVKAIQQLQSYDGGFRYWPNSSCSDPYASSYAVLALARAKEVGYAVDKNVLAQGQKFLAETVVAGKEIRCAWGTQTPSTPVRTFAVYALARSGAPKPSYYPVLLSLKSELPLFGRAMLADAMFIGGGDRAQAKNLLTELMNNARETAAGVHFEESDKGTYAPLWSSDARTTAIVLQTLTDISPDHPFVSKIGHYLVASRQKDGTFRTTQEAAFSLMALAEVVRVKEKDAPDFTAKILLGDQQVSSTAFQGRSVGVKHETVPMEKLTMASGKLPLVFSKDGPGVLYYSALFRYAPQDLPTTPLDRGLVVQRWFEPYSGGGQSRQFFAGDLVRIRVRVGTSQTRHFVAVDVPLPAGLEPIDTSLASSAKQAPTPNDERPEGYENESAEDTYGEGETEGSFDRYAHSFWSPFNYEEHRDDRVTLFADELPPGVHTLSFVARATTPGDFVLKPAKAEEMYAPEVFGRSDGGRFSIALPQPVAAK